MDLQVEGKVFMVAASSKGLGFGITRELAKNGAVVCISSRTKADIEKAAEQLREETGATIHAAVFDASKPESITNWVNEVKTAFERIDGLVVNAGGPPAGNFDDFDDDAWQDAFNLTLMSAVRLIRGILPSMREGKGGSILTVTSMSVKEPINRLLLSNVFRSGVTSLVKSLSTELAKDNIRVNNLMPGRMDTERLRALAKNNATLKGISEKEMNQQMASVIPIGR